MKFRVPGDQEVVATTSAELRSRYTTSRSYRIS